MTYEPAEYFRLTSDVPTEEEMDLAEEMREDSEADDEWSWMQEKLFDKSHPTDRRWKENGRVD